jgi:hypothetical protein
MDERMRAALAPVVRDLAATGAPGPRIVDSDWGVPELQLTAMLEAPDGSGAGVAIHLSETPAESVVRAADMVQEFVIEMLWGSAPTNWPPCQQHPATHPMVARLVDDVPTWMCPVGAASTPIGTLGPTRRP